jgi:hypothetical protein
LGKLSALHGKQKIARLSDLAPQRGEVSHFRMGAPLEFKSVNVVD